MKAPERQADINKFKIGGHRYVTGKKIQRPIRPDRFLQ